MGFACWPGLFDCWFGLLVLWPLEGPSVVLNLSPGLSESGELKTETKCWHFRWPAALWHICATKSSARNASMAPWAPENCFRLSWRRRGRVLAAPEMPAMPASSQPAAAPAIREKLLPPGVSACRALEDGAAGASRPPQSRRWTKAWRHQRVRKRDPRRLTEELATVPQSFITVRILLLLLRRLRARPVGWRAGGRCSGSGR